MQAFTNQEISLLFASLSLLGAGLIFSFYGKSKLSALFIVIGSLGMAFFAAILSPWLQMWDEQFHALVARNMISDPFTPRLFPHEPIYSNHNDWAYTYIWLHKQPFFLWIMGLSVWAFGTNYLAVRLPSILLHALLSLITMRTGKLLFDQKTGALAAVFISVAQFPLELLSGTYATDHNDFFFLFLISASIWAFVEYRFYNKTRFILLSGMFIGFAVLTKWLTGLLLFSGWGLMLLIFHDERRSLEKWKDIVIAALIATVIFLPWQLYTLLAFPIESNYEFAYNTRHFFEVIEKHGGDLWYHYNAIFMLYGKPDLIPVFAIASMILMLFTSKDRKVSMVLFVMVFVIYLFYTIAKTKMLAFCLPVAMIVFISFANSMLFVFHLIQRKIKFGKYPAFLLLLIAVVGLSYIFLNINLIIDNNRDDNPDEVLWRKTKQAKQQYIIDNLDVLSEEKSLIFCDWPWGHIALMFYTGNEAHTFIPQEWELMNMGRSGQKVIVISRNKRPDNAKPIPNITFIQYDYYKQ
ncbi:MAG: glycosyltransferase family 39 protein [Bacteroidales bacterium]|nr:glycosyltransferase family 39 protein [Bacteroidales bacterium]